MNIEYILQTECEDYKNCWEDIQSYKTKEEALKEYEDVKNCKRKVRVIEVTTKLIS
jgi:hypothetical protein